MMPRRWCIENCPDQQNSLSYHDISHPWETPPSNPSGPSLQGWSPFFSNVVVVPPLLLELTSGLTGIAMTVVLLGWLYDGTPFVLLYWLVIGIVLEREDKMRESSLCLNQDIFFSSSSFFAFFLLLAFAKFSWAGIWVTVEVMLL